MEKTKLNIALLSLHSGKTYRGVETFVHELGNQLSALGHNITVFQSGPSHKEAKYATRTILPKNSSPFPDTFFPFINKCADISRDFTKKVLSQIDLQTDIIFPTNGQWQAVLCKLWAKKHKKKIVISGQSGPGIDDRINLFCFPDYFVGLTSHQTKWAKRANLLVKTHTIPNGANTTLFTPKAKKIDFNLPHPIILNVSALIRWKRQKELIKAVSQLKQGSLLLVGSGPKQKQYDTLCKKLLPGRYKITSFPYNKMPSVYASADLFSFPTVPWESFGIAMVEAMAAGLPVVATDDPIRREIVGNAGYLVNPQKTNRYAQTLKKALQKNWGDLPRKQAEKFSWEVIAKKYEKLFLKVVKEK
jgi:glycosyltransferase involved in cell wall biosynthesis